MVNDQELERSYYNNYLANVYPMLRSSSTSARTYWNANLPGPRTPDTPWDAGSVYAARTPQPHAPWSAPAMNRAPCPPPILTEDERTRQQMLMLLLNRPASQVSHESSYRIDWSGEDIQTPVVPPGADSRARNEPPWPQPPLRSSPNPLVSPASANTDPHDHPRDYYRDIISPIHPPHAHAHTDVHTRSIPTTTKAMEAALDARHARPPSPDDLPPPYDPGDWTGPIAPPRDPAVVQGRLHPAFRESRFLRTGGNEREERRRAIEAASRPGSRND